MQSPHWRPGSVMTMPTWSEAEYRMSLIPFWRPFQQPAKTQVVPRPQLPISGCFSLSFIFTKNSKNLPFFTKIYFPPHPHHPCSQPRFQNMLCSPLWGITPLSLLLNHCQSCRTACVLWDFSGAGRDRKFQVLLIWRAPLFPWRAGSS